MPTANSSPIEDSDVGAKIAASYRPEYVELTGYEAQGNIKANLLFARKNHLKNYPPGRRERGIVGLRFLDVLENLHPLSSVEKRIIRALEGRIKLWAIS
jgi:hypothetical protein